MRRDAQPNTAVPAGTIEHEDDLLGGTGANRFGEGGQLDLEERDTDCRSKGRKWDLNSA
jgi:hypothetical protein